MIWHRLKKGPATRSAKHEALALVSPAPSPVGLVDPAPAATCSKAPGSIATACDGKADDLKLIWGVGPEIEKLLNQNGIYHFDQVSAWTKADLTWFDTMCKAFEGRVEWEKWVEQAKKLASVWRPDREIGEKPAGLTVLSGPRGGKADDLKLIWGVGPKLEKLFNGASFFHFDQLAKWGAADIEWVDSQLGEFAGRAVRDKWVEQCKKLATGWRPESEVGEKPE
jgi:predicted flap endonuclease-1-like 5' DNA nuclease